MRRDTWLAMSMGVFLALPLLQDSLHAQEITEVGIRIVEPAGWGDSPTRGLEVRAKRSLRVVGLVSHPSGVGKVLLNGEEASLSQEDGGQVRFSGFVRVEEGMDAVEVSAFPMTGAVVTRNFGLVPVPAGQAYEIPGQAWSESAGGSRGERWAVVIGVGEYQDGQIPPLRFADDDAEALRDFLLSDASGMGGFEDDHVRVLLNEDATYRNIRSALFSFLRGATEDDIVLIYFAGHGAPDPGRLQDHYLLAYDTDLNDLPATALLMEDVNDAVRRLYYRHLLVIADACHSGGVGGQTATRALSLNTVNNAFLDRIETTEGGHVTFTASQVNQLSQEDARWGGGHGVFTYYFLEGLRGRADEDGDRIVTLGEAMEYVRDGVRRDTRNAQIPTISQTAFDWYLPMSVVLEEGLAQRQEEDAEDPPTDPTALSQDRVPPDTPPAGTEALESAARPLPRISVRVQVPALGKVLGENELSGIVFGVIEEELRTAGLQSLYYWDDQEWGDVVLTADVTFSDQGEVMVGMRSAGMGLSLSARERGNPAILTSSRQTSTGAGLSLEAAARAAAERGIPVAMETISGELKGRWAGEGDQTFSLLLQVSGLEGYGQVIWLTENLGSVVPQTAAIVERAADLTEGTAQLEWFTPLTSAEVARALEARSLSGAQIEILRVLPGSIEIRVRTP